MDMYKIYQKGGIWKVHMVRKGVSQKSMLGPQGGGGSKSPENWPTWFMNDP